VRGILVAATLVSPTRIEILGVAERVSALVRPRAVVPRSIRRYYTGMRALERTRELPGEFVGAMPVDARHSMDQ